MPEAAIRNNISFISQILYLLNNENFFVFLFHEIIFSCEFFQIISIWFEFIQLFFISICLLPVKINLGFKIFDLRFIFYPFGYAAVTKEKKHHNQYQKENYLIRCNAKYSFWSEFCYFNFHIVHTVRFIIFTNITCFFQICEPFMRNKINIQATIWTDWTK